MKIKGLITVKFTLLDKVMKGRLVRDNGKSLTVDVDGHEYEIHISYVYNIDEIRTYSKLKDDTLRFRERDYKVSRHALRRIEERLNGSQPPLMKLAKMLKSKDYSFIEPIQKVKDIINHGGESLRVLFPGRDAVVIFENDVVVTVIQYSRSKYKDKSRYVKIIPGEQSSAA